MTSPGPVPGTHGGSWTDERAEKARKLWTVDGYSASQIAKALGGVTRNAVIGKLCRLGLTGEGEGARKRAHALSERPAKAARVPTRVYAPRSAPALKIAGRGTVFEEGEARPARVVIPFRDEAPGCCTVLTIGPRMCRWPIGDPGADDFTFCGARADGTYCPGHHMRSISAFQPDAKPRPYAVRGG